MLAHDEDDVAAAEKLVNIKQRQQKNLAQED